MGYLKFKLEMVLERKIGYKNKFMVNIFYK